MTRLAGACQLEGGLGLALRVVARACTVLHLPMHSLNNADGNDGRKQPRANSLE